MPHLQRYYEQFRSKGLVVLGLNCADEPRIARRLLQDKGVTFPNIVDPSDVAQRVVFQDYRGMAVPLQYFIDREGRVADVWAGEDDARALKVLEGLEVQPGMG